MSDAIPFRPETKMLADDANDLLKSKAFQAAILALRKQWFAELMASNNDELDRALKAQMRALEAIPQELQVFVNNQKMHEARQKS